MKPVEFDPEARAELDHAASRYEAERPGLGHRFYDAVERSVRAVALTPAAGALFPGIPQAQLDAWAREGVVELWGQIEDMPEPVGAAGMTRSARAFSAGTR